MPPAQKESSTHFADGRIRCIHYLEATGARLPEPTERRSIRAGKEQTNMSRARAKQRATANQQEPGTDSTEEINIRGNQYPAIHSANIYSASRRQKMHITDLRLERGSLAA